VDHFKLKNAWRNLFLLDIYEPTQGAPLLGMRAERERREREEREKRERREREREKRERRERR
jgi:hypothetical protein